MFVFIHLRASLRSDRKTSMRVKTNGQVDAVAGEEATAVGEEEEEGN